MKLFLKFYSILYHKSFSNIGLNPSEIPNFSSQLLDIISKDELFRLLTFFTIFTKIPHEKRTQEVSYNTEKNRNMKASRNS